MSIQAMDWARRLRVGNLTTKTVLMAIANYANDEARAWPALTQVAFDIEASDDTVRRHVRLLEQLGLIARFERYSETDGRRTSDEIRLLLHVTEVLPHSHAEDAERSSSAGPPSANCGGPPPQAAEYPSAPVRSTPPQSCGGIEPSLEPSEEPLPPTPLRGEEAGLAQDWQEFNRAWSAEVGAIEKPVSAERLFRAFTAEERARIRRSVAIYGEFLRRTGRKALAAHTFLREKTFESYQPGGEAAAIATRSFVETGTPEWRAWEAFYRFLGRGAPPLTRLDGRPGWWFATALPPVDAAACPLFVELGTPQWMRWKEFLGPSLAAVGMEAPRHAPLPAEFAGPKVLRPAHPQPVRGWLFPSEWPPARGAPPSVSEGPARPNNRGSP